MGQINQKELFNAVFAKIKLQPGFPVSAVDHTWRDEIPIEAHVHDCLEIGCCVKGAGLFLVENKILSFHAGDAVVINHRELHTMKGAPGQGAEWYFVNLAPAALLAGTVREDEALLDTEPFSGADFDNILTAERHPELCSLATAIINELRFQKTGYRSIVRAQVWEFMVRLHRRAPRKSGDELAPGPVERKKLSLVTPAIQHITQHYHEDITMETLAHLCRYSVSNFRKLFNAATGYSPNDYLQRVRMEAVTTLLRHSSDSIIEIALKTGYSTLSNFNRQFRTRFGISPRTWRARNKG